jgi:hypothetical protein
MDVRPAIKMLADASSYVRALEAARRKIRGFSRREETKRTIGLGNKAARLGKIGGL